jgi:hypothetical protein
MPSNEIDGWLPPLTESGRANVPSLKFPTVSNAPSDDTQALRDPVAATTEVLFVLQSLVPLSAPGSGVPMTPACHSAFDGSETHRSSCLCGHAAGL